MSKILYITNLGGKRMAYGFSGTAIEAAHSLGHEFYSVANRSKSTAADIREDSEKYGVKLLHIDLARSPFSLQNLKAYKQLVKIIRSEKIDYIHCNTPVGGVLGRLAGKKCKVKKVIYQAHGFHFYKGAPLLNWLLFFPIEWICSFFTDVLITINQEDYHFAKKHMHAKEIRYIPGVGIDVTKYQNIQVDKAAKRKELGIPVEGIVLLSVGELNENKNHRVVVEALEKMKRNDIYYVICGIGNQKEALEQLAEELGVRKQLILLGYRNDIIEINHCSDIFVFPSKREGLPVSLMEAMIAGLPCVVSKIRGNVDLIEDGKGGFLCDLHHPDEFKEKLNYLVTNQEIRKKFGKENREKIKRFSHETVKQEMEETYREVLK